MALSLPRVLLSLLHTFCPFFYSFNTTHRVLATLYCTTPPFNSTSVSVLAVLQPFRVSTFVSAKFPHGSFIPRDKWRIQQLPSVTVSACLLLPPPPPLPPPIMTSPHGQVNTTTITTRTRKLGTMPPPDRHIFGLFLPFCPFLLNAISMALLSLPQPHAS